MKIALFLVILTLFATPTDAQRQRSTVASKRRAAAQKPREIGKTVFVIDTTLSVLRTKPSLFAESVMRMRIGRKVLILGVSEGDGVRFFRVSAPPSNTGWVQADAVFGDFRDGDEVRLARMVQASNGFEQLELASQFFKIFPRSKFRPSILLLYGDLLEDTAVKLSRDANNRLKRSEMAASAAPLHSYYLNFASLDRYRKLGVRFLFNSTKQAYHYDGESWKEIVKSYSAASEAAEARKRLDSLVEKMERAADK